MPGMTRYRRSTCGCGAFGHKHELQAFQPKWCNSSPMAKFVCPTIWAYVEDFGSTSTTVMASGRCRLGSKLATYASFSGGALDAMRGDG